MRRVVRIAVLSIVLVVMGGFFFGCGDGRADVVVENTGKDRPHISEDIVDNETDPSLDSTVYVTPSGTRYHYSKGCAGTNASAVILEDVKYTRQPCGTCAKEDIGRWETESETEVETETETETESFSERIVYVTPTGKKYHYSRDCAGKNAIEKSLEDAIKMTEGPCKKCERAWSSR